MSMLDSINGFVDTMIEEQHQFEAIQNKVSHCENSVEDIIVRLEKRERTLVEGAQQKMGNVDNVAAWFQQ